MNIGTVTVICRNKLSQLRVSMKKKSFLPNKWVCKILLKCMQLSGMKKSRI